MIFVALGTQKFQLNRLLAEIDRLISAGRIQEEVLAQVGYSDYRPCCYNSVDFLPRGEFEEKVKKCNLLVTHGGVGTIVTGLNYRKPVIVYPRLVRFGEHVDDHQREIGELFRDLNYVLLCGEKDDLGERVAESRIHQFHEYQSQREKVIDCIRSYLCRCAL